MKRLLLAKLTILFFINSNIIAQSTESIIIITDINSKIIVDGSEAGQCESGRPLKVATSSGEHYIQAVCVVNGKSVEKNEVVTVEQSKQKVIKILFNENSLPTTSALNNQSIAIANLNVTIPGSLAIATWKNDHPNEQYPVPEYYYAFEKGDEIVIDMKMTNKNGTNAINISTYPDGVEKYSNKAFSELTDLRIKVEERSIYRIAFASNFAFDRNGLLSIRRIPSSGTTVDFNTTVVKEKIYTPIVIQESQNLFVNSGSNATFSNGKSRVLLPIKLPPNTIEWFYRFSASRNKEDIDNVKANFKLFSELTKLTVNLTSGPVAGKMAGVAVDKLSQPPGSNYCDIFLLDYNNISAFEAKNDGLWKYYLEGSRKNFMSGNVKVQDPSINSGNWYLGIRNPDTYYGINVFVEIVAITMKEDWVMAQK